MSDGSTPEEVRDLVAYYANYLSSAPEEMLCAMEQGHESGALIEYETLGWGHTQLNLTAWEQHEGFRVEKVTRPGEPDTVRVYRKPAD